MVSFLRVTPGRYEKKEKELGSLLACISVALSIIQHCEPHHFLVINDLHHLTFKPSTTAEPPKASHDGFLEISHLRSCSAAWTSFASESRDPLHTPPSKSEKNSSPHPNHPPSASLTVPPCHRAATAVLASEPAEAPNGLTKRQNRASLLFLAQRPIQRVKLPTESLIRICMNLVRRQGKTIKEMSTHRNYFNHMSSSMFIILTNENTNANPSRPRHAIDGASSSLEPKGKTVATVKEKQALHRLHPSMGF